MTCDAYFEPEVEEELFDLADSAEQFFDRLIIRGLSKTEKTPTGQKKSVEVLSERRIARVDLADAHVVVIDTNVLLHYQPLDQLPWQSRLCQASTSYPISR